MSNEEFEKHKQDVLDDLEREKYGKVSSGGQNDKNEAREAEFRHIFDFSRDIERPLEEPNNTSREEDEAVEIGDMSALDNGMEDVKELKR